MRDRGISQLPVTSGGVLVGMVTEADLMNFLGSGEGTPDALVSKCMTRHVPASALPTPLSALEELLSKSPAAVVVDDERAPVGILSRIDLLHHLSMPIVAGRGFSREDDATTTKPVLINVQLARTIFGDANPIGQVIPEKADPKPDPQHKPKRVVGVIEDFRQNGPYSMPEAVLFDRLRLDIADTGVPDRLLIRVRPGTTAALEPVLVRRLQREAADWSFGVSTMEHLRERKLSDYIMPLTVLSVLAGFLLLMVTLGLTGVVWQSVIVRLREFGLRRAAGASGASVRRQVFAEMAVMTSFAVIAGSAIVGQLPFLPLPEGVKVAAPVFAGAVALTAAAIYCLTLVCGWYPSRLAARIPPADALRYE